MNKPVYFSSLSITILATLGGFITLLPRAAASYPNILGYSSVCTFAPAASLYCFFIAGLSCFIRSVFFKYETGSAGVRLKKHARSVIPLGLVLLLALGSTVWFGTVKSQYTDTVSTATVTES